MSHHGWYSLISSNLQKTKIFPGQGPQSVRPALSQLERPLTWCGSCWPWRPGYLDATLTPAQGRKKTTYWGRWQDIAGYCRTALIFGIEFFSFFGNLEKWHRFEALETSFFWLESAELWFSWYPNVSKLAAFEALRVAIEIALDFPSFDKLQLVGV